MNSTVRYPCDLERDGRTPPQARWPDGVRVAIQFVPNDKEGGEISVLHGDAGCKHRGLMLTVRLRAAKTKALRRMVRPVRANAGLSEKADDGRSHSVHRSKTPLLLSSLPPSSETP